jgi:prolyl 4-hydroxylase
MNEIVWRSFDEYAKQWDFPFVDIENVSVQRYEPAQKYDVHTDAGPGLPRVCSALVYLNTVEFGGETYFPHFDYKVTPVEGTLVIFPSNYVYAHAALPPKTEVKYAAAYWARG